MIQHLNISSKSSPMIITKKGGSHWVPPTRGKHYTKHSSVHAVSESSQNTGRLESAYSFWLFINYKEYTHIFLQYHTIWIDLGKIFFNNSFFNQIEGIF